MRTVVLALMLALAPVAAEAQLVRAQQQTDVAFAADDANGMLVIAENGGASYPPGEYRFVRIDREAGQASEPIDVDVGAARGPAIFGYRDDAPMLISTTFHYAIVPPGEYALIFWSGQVNRVVSHTVTHVCLNEAAPIYAVTAGNITVFRAPTRIDYDLVRDNGTVRRAVLRRYPAGTTIDFLHSEEKLGLDFAEIKATNTRLTAPHAIAAPIGTLAFEARERATRNQCVVGEGFVVTGVE
jgi:hypothetical protein